MPLHDWHACNDGDFHSFHSAWITTLTARLNNGILPDGVYAQAEQSIGLTGDNHRRVPDLQVEDDGSAFAWQSEVMNATIVAPVADVVADADPFSRRQKSVWIRRDGGDLIAAIEVVSASNRSHQGAAEAFAAKMLELCERGVHVLILDVLPSRSADLFKEVLAAIGSDADPLGSPCTLSIEVPNDPEDRRARVYASRLRVGEALPESPLFLAPRRYVSMPLEETYAEALYAQPKFVRAKLAETLSDGPSSDVWPRTPVSAGGGQSASVSAH